MEKLLHLYVYPALFIYSYIGQKDSITISVWNHKKVHKKQGAGFLGCVRIMSNAIQRLKDTGCTYKKVIHVYIPSRKNTLAPNKTARM